MRRVSYSKHTGEDLDIDGSDLVRALADELLNSGFYQQFVDLDQFDPNSIEALRDAIERALLNGELFDRDKSDDLIRRLEQMPGDQFSQLVDQLIDKMEDEGYISRQTGGTGSSSAAKVRFEITDKSIDFLGYKTLKDLLGTLGRSSFGAHDTRALSTGVEVSGSSKLYEFGDTLNVDAMATLASALSHQPPGGQLDIDYSDLHIHQADYQSSCATVLMLDCSHSMILYGEDRFTPAKRVALALATLIRTQFPGDSLHCVLFHDSAEELKISQLARVQVGPYYTNTRDGLILAQRILQREKKDMRQIVMITDGKPSCITLDDGRMYRNAFGLDPLVISKTLEEVNRCKRQGILINTFMLASDYGLIQFVQKVTELCRGKAYFTGAQNLGQYLLMDYMNRKTRTIH
jgi:Ca-activated chloride channel family protein